MIDVETYRKIVNDALFRHATAPPSQWQVAALSEIEARQRAADHAPLIAAKMAAQRTAGAAVEVCVRMIRCALGGRP